MKATILSVVCACAALVPAAVRCSEPSEAKPVGRPPAIFARVGDRVLTTLEFERELAERLKPYAATREKMLALGQWKDDNEDTFNRIRERLAVEVKRVLLRDALIEDIAQAAGLRPDEVLIETRLKTAAQRAGGFEALERQERRSLGDLRDTLRKTDTMRRFYRLFVPQGLPPTPSDIRSYYESNRQQMQQPERVGVSMILIPFGEDRVKAFEKAEDLRRELQFAPARFAERAKEHSAEKESAARGGVFAIRTTSGETDLLPANLLPKAWLAGLARAEVGRVTDTIETLEGFVLLKLDRIEKGRELVFSEAADRISEVLQRKHEETTIADWSDYYLGRSYVSGVDVAGLEGAAAVSQ